MIGWAHDTSSWREVSCRRGIFRVEEGSVCAMRVACHRMDLVIANYRFLKIFVTVFQSARSWGLGSPRKWTHCSDFGLSSWERITIVKCTRNSRRWQWRTPEKDTGILDQKYLRNGTWACSDARSASRNVRVDTKAKRFFHKTTVQI